MRLLPKLHCDIKYFFISCFSSFLLTVFNFLFLSLFPSPFFHSLFLAGVPKSRRGEVWLALCQQHRLKQRLPSRQQPPDTPYQDLLKQLTTQQHAILVDLGTYGPPADRFASAQSLQTNGYAKFDLEYIHSSSIQQHFHSFIEELESHTM